MEDGGHTDFTDRLKSVMGKFKSCDTHTHTHESDWLIQTLKYSPHSHVIRRTSSGQMIDDRAKLIRLPNTE